MSEDPLKELREESKELEERLSNMIMKFQNKFGVEIREISVEHRQADGRNAPYSTDVSVDVKLT